VPQALLRGLLLLAAPVLALGAEEQYGDWLGEWEEVVATAYSPHDPIDGAYHATKGARWRWITADGRTDVRHTPYGVAVPLQPGTRKPHWPFGTQLVIPAETGYLARSRPDDRVFPVDDVGNGRQYFKRDQAGRLHIDLRFKLHASAIAWAGPTGRRVITVFRITGVAPPPPPPPPALPDPFPSLADVPMAEADPAPRETAFHAEAALPLPHPVAAAVVLLVVMLLRFALVVGRAWRGLPR